ncbi:hypothetical protein Pan216_02280 [Planctomycetes bacterium Pan216]|uniref:Tetratricopeptide repeat protein n=1 Tax=Kolteria novifilia TaxID=2527975 RepID=A0A518AXJ2_9BACT|nr:hypothetical protein Pan216_02280 [Planctomycetes bacterium Pan216]
MNRPTSSLKPSFLMMVMIATASPVFAADPAPVDPHRARASDRGVRDLFEATWEAPPERLKQLGRASLSRAARDGADMALLNYTYGVVLMKHNDVDAALSTFRRASRAASEPFLKRQALLNQAMAMFLVGQGAGALRTLEEIAKEGNPDLRTVDLIASVATFYQVNPSSSVRIGPLRQLEKDYFATLPAELQTRYRQRVKETQDYIGQIPALREKMLAEVTKLEEEMGKVAEQGRAAEVERVRQQQEIDAATLQVRLERQQLEAMLLSYDRLIQKAIELGDTTLAKQLTRQKADAIARADLSLSIHRTKQQQAVAARAIIDENLGLLTRKHRALQQQTQSERRRIDDQLSRPPVPFVPEYEKKALLEYAASLAALPAPANPMPTIPTKNEPAEASPDDEGRARSFLSMARTLEKRGRLEPAAERYQRIVDDFPKTKAATEAADRLKDLRRTTGS